MPDKPFWSPLFYFSTRKNTIGYSVPYLSSVLREAIRSFMHLLMQFSEISRGFFNLLSEV